MGAEKLTRLWRVRVVLHDAIGYCLLELCRESLCMACPGKRTSLLVLLSCFPANQLRSCDEIYIISSAAFKQSDHEKILSTIRFLNKREAAIHTIGRWETYGEIWRHVAGQRQPFVSSLLVTPFWDTPSDTVSQKLQLLQPSMSETGRLLLVFVFN